MKLLISQLFILFFVFNAQATPLNTIQNNNEAVEELNQALKAKSGPSDGFMAEVLSYWHAGKKLVTDLLDSDIEKAKDPLAGRVSAEPTDEEQEKNKSNMDIEIKALNAQSRLVEALSSDSFAAKSFLNLGLSYELLKNNENAYKAYQQGYKNSKGDRKLEFIAYYNMARIKGKLKKIDEALALYQKALSYVPESVQIKNNIELLLQEKQGKGKGEGKDPKQPQDKDKKSEQDKNNPEKFENKPKKQEFKSQNLKKEDMQKIMDEIKKQEQKIRAREFGKQRKDPPRDKDW